MKKIAPGTLRGRGQSGIVNRLWETESKFGKFGAEIPAIRGHPLASPEFP